MILPDIPARVAFMDWSPERINGFAEAWNNPDTKASEVADVFGIPLTQARMLAHKLCTSGRPMSTAKGVLREHSTIPTELQVTLDAVTLALAFEYETTAEDIRGKCRKRTLARARFAVAWAGRRIGLSWKQIAKYLGRPSHTSALWMCSRAGEPEIAAAKRALEEMGTS